MSFASFFVIHFEAGWDIKNLVYQEAFWPATTDLVALADQYNTKLTLQFNPQWAEYILKNSNNLAMIRRWQQEGHEVGLHHHGYDHGDWNGYTNRVGKEVNPKFRGSIQDMMKLVSRFVGADHLVSGTITDEESDYPERIAYDTEGIRICHARSTPKRVNLGGNNKIIQVGMALLSWEGDIESFKREYEKAKRNEVFGVVTHEKDFAKNPTIIEEWMRFVRSSGKTIKTVSQIITEYQKSYAVKYSNKPLTFLNDVMGTPSVTKGKY